MSSSSTGGMPSHGTASAIAAKTVPVSHDLAISGYSAIKRDCRGYIKSATFAGAGRRWYLRYYPHGCISQADNHRGVTFLLYQDPDKSADDQNISLVSTRIDYRVSLLGPDGNPVGGFGIRNKTTTLEPDQFIPQRLIDTADLEQYGFLRDDAFSVRCEFDVPIIVAETTVLPPSQDLEQPPPTQTTHVPADVHEGLIRVFSDEVPTDVALEVGDETFRAHKCLLAARSPMFAALFTGPMMESTAPSVRIDDMEPRVFKAMLDFIYRGNYLPPLDEGDSVAMTQHLLVAADRYNLERLKYICAEKLRGHINMSIVASTLDLAQRHGCQALKDACCDYLASHRDHLKAILKSEGFEQLIIDFPSVIVELLARVAPSPR